MSEKSPEKGQFNPESNQVLYELPLDLKKDTCDPEILERTLIEKRNDIVSRIDQKYLEQQQRFPDYDDIYRPPYKVLRLHSKQDEPLTQKGLDNGTRIHSDISEIKEKYHPYWNAILGAGFIPEVRSDWFGYGIGGAMLMLRDSPPGTR